MNNTSSTRFGRIRPNLHGLIRSSLFLDAILIIIIVAQYIGYPAAAGLLLHDYGFFSFILGCVALSAFLGGVFYRKRAVARLNVVTQVLLSLIFFFLFLFLNGPFNVPVAIISVIMLVLNVFGLVLNAIILSNPAARKRLTGSREFLEKVDWKFKYPRLKQAALLLGLFAIATIGTGTYYNWNEVITVRAPDGFKTISSYWGPPSLTLIDSTVNVNVSDLGKVDVVASNMDHVPEKYVNGSFAYATSVNVANDSKNYCNYTNARSFPNGTIFLSETLPANTSSVIVSFRYVHNHEVLAYLQQGNSTLIMNHHSSSHPQYPNGYWYYNDNFFESIEKTYLFQLLDFWGVKYYLNVHNGIDFPHVFNYRETVPLCYTMIDWFVLQRDRGLCTNFLGISPDFEEGDYEKLWWDNYTSDATPLPPGSLLPGIVSQDEWYSLNSQNETLFAEATAAWEQVYTYASQRGFKSYIVFQGGAMRDTIDGDIQVSRLPIYPISKNPDVRYGIMSYQDSQDDIEGGRYKQYRDCVDQIRIFGEQGRSILTGWITKDNDQWYVNDTLGLGRYIEDVLIAQAAGMTEIFHAPIYRLQATWGDEAVLILHQALNEWEKREFKFRVPAWQYRSNYMDAIQNLNRPWQFYPFVALVAAAILFGAPFNLAKKMRVIGGKK